MWLTFFVPRNKFNQNHQIKKHSQLFITLKNSKFVSAQQALIYKSKKFFFTRLTIKISLHTQIACSFLKTIINSSSWFYIDCFAELKKTISKLPEARKMNMNYKNILLSMNDFYCFFGWNIIRHEWAQNCGVSLNH